MRKLFVLILITLVSLFALAAPAMAMDWRQADRAVVGKDEVINDDTTLTGTNVIVDGTINGDLFAFGKSIVVNGTVNGNLIAAGERVEIKGAVTGSVYGAAQEISVSGRIERTIAAAGANVTLEPGGYVGSTGLLAGEQIHVNGQIGRGALLGGARVDLNGQIGNDLKAYVDDLRIGPGAVIAGPVDYTSASTATVEQGARTGAVSFHQAPKVNRTGSAWWKVLRTLGFFLAGLAVLALVPSLRRRYPELIARKPWQAPVVGLVALISVPIGAVLLLATVIGIPFSLVTMALFPAMIYLSQIFVSWTAGKLIADRVEAFRNLPWPVIFLMGAVLTTVLIALPGAGCVFGAGALLYGLGGLYYLMVGARTMEASV